MARPPLAVRLDRPRVGDGGLLGLQQLDGLAPHARRRLKEGPVRLLRRVGEAPVEAVQDDRGPAFGHRKAVAPHP
jgi:hypothetical protein